MEKKPFNFDFLKKIKMDKKLAKKIGYYALLGVFCLIFVFSAIYIVDYLIETGEAKSEYNHLQDMYNPPSRPPITESTEDTGATTDPSVSTDPTVDTTPTGPTDPAIPTVLPELQPFLAMNPDLVGWITIPDTVISYPVVQSTDRPDYYLDHTFEGKKNTSGAIYAREVCNILLPSDNITLYGHHMKNGTMFAALDGYKSKAFWETHQYIYFDNLYERHTYQVIAVFKTSANYGEGYAYHLFADANEDADFNLFIKTIKSLDLYDTGLTAHYGDKLITLSTCEYTLDNGRLVVVAKRIS